MFQNHTRVIRARWIVPVNTSPIENGWVRVGGGKIHEVGSGRPPSDAVDLGDVALLPRLINAHTHLEFSDLKHPVGTRGIAFTDWIKLVIEKRLTADPGVKDAILLKAQAPLSKSLNLYATQIIESINRNCLAENTSRRYKNIDGFFRIGIEKKNKDPRLQES